MIDSISTTLSIMQHSKQALVYICWAQKLSRPKHIQNIEDVVAHKTPHLSFLYTSLIAYIVKCPSLRDYYHDSTFLNLYV